MWEFCWLCYLFGLDRFIIKLGISKGFDVVINDKIVLKIDDVFFSSNSALHNVFVGEFLIIVCLHHRLWRR
jgi:hypothetical protein